MFSNTTVLRPKDVFQLSREYRFPFAGTRHFWETALHTRVVVLSLSEPGDVLRAEISNRDNIWMWTSPVFFL